MTDTQPEQLGDTERLYWILKSSPKFEQPNLPKRRVQLGFRNGWNQGSNLLAVSSLLFSVMVPLSLTIDQLLPHPAWETRLPTGPSAHFLQFPRLERGWRLLWILR